MGFRNAVRRLRNRYGADPLQLLVLLASFALAGYAALRLLPAAPVAIAVWFVGGAVGHDLFLLPLYALVDRSLVRLSARSRARAGRGLPTVGWLNHLRVPLALSGLLLLVYFPAIFRLSTPYAGITGLSSASYLGNWLAVTGGLFAVSAVLYALRLRHRRRHPQESP